MHLSTGRLTDNAQPCPAMRLHDRAGTAWQGIGAMVARADIAKQLRQRLAHFPRDKKA